MPTCDPYSYVYCFASITSLFCLFVFLNFKEIMLMDKFVYNLLADFRTFLTY